MNKLSAIMFTTGVVTGILGTVLYMRNKYEIVEMEDLSKESDELANKCKKLFSEERRKQGAVVDEDAVVRDKRREVVVVEEAKEEIATTIEPKEYPQTGRTDKSEFHYHWDRKGIRSEMENAHPSELEVPHDGPEIEVISFEDFNEHNEHYDKLTISYYTKDDILADENDDVMEKDQRAFIGDEALNSFGGFSGDKDVVYVRNHPYTIDYEVVRVHGKYSEVVLGEFEDDEEAS